MEPSGNKTPSLWRYPQQNRLLFSMITAVFFVALLFLFTSSLPTALADNNKYIHIIMLEQPPLALYEGGIDGLPPTSTSITGASRLDIQSPASTAYLNYLSVQQVDTILALEALLGRDVNVPFQYNATLNGFAAEITLNEASLALSLPMVTRVEKDYTRYLHTDVGPQWIGAPGIWDGSDTSEGLGTRGEGIVIGVIDTGVNTDHPSFAATGPVDGYVHTNPRGTFFGLCDPVLGTPFCNNKLIGVYDFTGTAPEDDNGHGSHTASTAAGNVVDAALLAPTITVNRTISGVAPHANIIAYKACVTTPAIGTCPISALIAAINQATLDEVDVINYSIGGGSSDPWSDLDAQSFFSARSAGIFIATSAGNDGPGAATLGSPADAPWVLSVAASTHNRRFVNALSNMSGGNTTAPADIEGKSVTSSYGPAPIVYAGDFGNALCGDGTAEAPINPFPPGTFKGEIVVCDRGTFARVDKARHVGESGAGGFVLANDIDSGDSLVGDAYPIPGVHISYDDGLVLKAWLASGSGHTGLITGTTADENPNNGDIIASFSSRGPNPAATDLVKPDITAPGVDILAAFNTSDPLATDPEFGVISGTSMSSPHVAGSGALLRALHPDWTPDEIKSALMTTAFNAMPGNLNEAHIIYKEDGATAADPFDTGSGRVDLSQAGQAGLVLDETPSNYNAANPASGGDPKTLNIASMGDSNCQVTCTWTREVRSTADSAVTWTAAAAAPAGMALSVTPSTFTISPGQTQLITIEANVTGVTVSGWHFAQVTLHADLTGVPSVHFPVAISTLGGVSNPQIALHFQGNLDEGCSGDGRADIIQCDGPFLDENPVLDNNPAAQFGPVAAGINGTSDRNIYDPNWVWHLSEPTTVEGVMTVEWWASCGGCGAGVATADWNISVWADGGQQFVQRITATPALPNVPSKLRTSVILPAISASSTFVLQIDPVYIDSQQNSIIYYDSSSACPGATEAPCDSIVFMPVAGLDEPQGGGFVTGAGWLNTVDGDRLNFFVRARDNHPQDKEATLRVRDDAADVRIDVPESSPLIAIGHVQESCGTISAGSNAIEYHASGTFNGSPASFRVCVEDNDEPGNNPQNPDLFYMECISGCSYNTASRTHDDGIDGGNIKIHVAPSGSADKPTMRSGKMNPAQTVSASVLALDPLLLSEAPLGSLELLTVQAFDADGDLVSGVDVTIIQTLSDGSTESFTAVTGLDGLATFNVTLFSGDSEFVAYDGDLSSNAVNITAIP